MAGQTYDSTTFRGVTCCLGGFDDIPFFYIYDCSLYHRCCCYGRQTSLLSAKVGNRSYPLKILKGCLFV